MSLLITASPWNSNDSTDKKNRTYSSNKNIKQSQKGFSSSHDDSGGGGGGGGDDDTDYPPKKRPSTMKRSYKYFTEPSPSDNENTDLMKLQNEDDDDTNQIIPSSIQSSKTIQEQRNNKINKILEKMTSIHEENDGSGLGDFRPPPRPILNSKGLEPVDLLPKTPSIVPRQSVELLNTASPNYRPNDSTIFQQNDSAELRDYRKIYTPPSSVRGGVEWRNDSIRQPLAESGNGNDDRLMKKIHYMIHLLEEQRKEKTDNIMEEFILYTFLGIFIIYIADSFSRSGKYTR
jgi:hypothetical protein